MRTSTWITALLVLSAFGTGGCGARCVNSVSTRVTSPDGARDAVVYTRDCGAGTSGSVQVEVVARGSNPEDKPSTLFIIDHPLDSPGRVDLTWTGPTHLVVSYPSGSRIAKQEASRGELSVSYGPRL